MLEDHCQSTVAHIAPITFIVRVLFRLPPCGRCDDVRDRAYAEGRRWLDRIARQEVRWAMLKVGNENADARFALRDTLVTVARTAGMSLSFKLALVAGPDDGNLLYSPGRQYSYEADQ
jgi:hypothetical protein